MLTMARDTLSMHIYGRSPLEYAGVYLEAPSWKHQLALASFLGLLASFVVRLLIPVYLEAIGPTLQFFIALGVVVMSFFLPFLWWRTTNGYINAVIAGIIGVATSVGGLIRVPAGELPVESYLILIPALLFSLLLIGSSVLAWRED